MKVVCRYSCFGYIKGNIYEVDMVSESSNSYCVEGRWLRSEMFITLEEYREQQLNEILNNLHL